MDVHRRDTHTHEDVEETKQGRVPTFAERITSPTGVEKCPHNWRCRRTSQHEALSCARGQRALRALVVCKHYGNMPTPRCLRSPCRAPSAASSYRRCSKMAKYALDFGLQREGHTRACTVQEQCTHMQLTTERHANLPVYPV